MKNYFQSVFVLVPLFALSGCITANYTPGHYSLAEDRIQPLTVRGEIEYLNSYPKDLAGVIEEQGHKHNFSYKAVTDAFNQQLKYEILRREVGNNNTTAKTITSKVTHIYCGASFGSYVRNCQFTVELTTGDGKELIINASQNSPIFNSMPGSLNGTIATGVIESLGNRKLLAYLSAESVENVSIKSGTGPTSSIKLEVSTIGASSTSGGQVAADETLTGSDIPLSSTASSTTSAGSSGSDTRNAPYQISGQYTYTLKGSPGDFSRYYKSGQVSLEQISNKITGKFGKDGVIKGTVDGDTITFEWYTSWMEGNGAWKVDKNGRTMTGHWQRKRADQKGEWTLTRVE